MNKRLWINISIGLVFLALSATGILLFIVPYNSLFAGIHFWVGIAFIVATCFHLMVNFKPLLRYLKNKFSPIVAIVSGVLFCLIVITVNYRIAPISSVLDFGSKLRKTAVVTETRMQTIIIGEQSNENGFIIEIMAGEEYRGRTSPFALGLTTSYPPQFVFWLEDENGNFIKTIFITAKTGFPILNPDDNIRTNTILRVEAFPYWNHKRQGSVDGISGATPHGHFNIAVDKPASLKKFRVLTEVNRSFDYNDYYTKDRFPEDLVYSGSGNPAQPSIIYAADIDLSTQNKTFVLKPIGHGHHSGADGNLYTDMTGIDSALNIFKRVLVDFN